MPVVKLFWVVRNVEGTAPPAGMRLIQHAKQRLRSVDPFLRAADRLKKV